MTRTERVLVALVALLLLAALADVARSVRRIADDYHSLNVDDNEPAHLNPPRA
jgi:hypothetical protein